MKAALIAGCLALMLAGSAGDAVACGRGRGLGGVSMGRMMQAGMAAMRVAAVQQQYAAAQRAEVHRKHVATYSSLRDKQLAEREARRQLRLAEQSTRGASPSTSR